MRSEGSAGRLYREALQMELEAEKRLLGPPSVPGAHWTESRRRRAGAFYTPHRLVHFLVRKSLLPVLTDIRSEARGRLWARDVSGFQAVVREATRLRVVDPACGCGRFLLVAFRSLRALHVWLAGQQMRITVGRVAWEKAWEEGNLRALACLRGIDVNAAALAAASAALRHAAAGVASECPNLHVADVTNPEVAVLRRGSVAVCLGNPPWGAAGAGRESAKAVGIPASNANTFGIFLLRCLHSLAPGGRLGFVLPRNFCKGNDYAELRRKLLSLAALEWLGDAGRAFPGVTQEAVVIVARRLQRGETPGNVRVLSLVDGPGTSSCGYDVRCLEQNEMQKTPGTVIPLSLDNNILRLLRHIEAAAGGRCLRDWAQWHRGLEYGQDGALIRCSNCGSYTSLPKKKRARKRCATCGRTLEDRVADYQLISRHKDAQHSAPVYVGRHVRRYELASPYWLDPAVPGVKYKGEGFFAGPKILLPKISPALAAAWDPSDAYTTQGVYLLRPCFSPWDGYALLGLLNSSTLAYYYEYRCNDGATLTTNVTLANLLALPIPDAAGTGELLATVREGARLLSHLCRTGEEAQAAAAANAAVDRAVARLFGLLPYQEHLIASWWAQARR